MSIFITTLKSYRLKLTFPNHLFPDIEKPIILNMPANITQDTDSDSATAVVNWVAPNATDNSGSQTMTPSHSPGSSFSIGITPVEYSAIDPSGNIAFSIFAIDIKGTFTYIIIYSPLGYVHSFPVIFQFQFN